MIAREERIKKGYLKKFGMLSIWKENKKKKKKKKKGNTSKFVDAGSNNRNESVGINNTELIDRKRMEEKKLKL